MTRSVFSERGRQVREREMRKSGWTIKRGVSKMLLVRAQMPKSPQRQHVALLSVTVPASPGQLSCLGDRWGPCALVSCSWAHSLAQGTSALVKQCPASNVKWWGNAYSRLFASPLNGEEEEDIYSCRICHTCKQSILPPPSFSLLS